MYYQRIIKKKEEEEERKKTGEWEQGIWKALTNSTGCGNPRV